MPNATRDEILKVVKQLYSRFSYSEISTTRIIRECGISRGSLYWHFSTKEEIFAAVFNECYRSAVEATRINVKDGDSAVQAIKTRLRNLVALSRRDPECMPVIKKHISDVLLRDAEKKFPFGLFFDDIRRYVRAGLEKGELYPFPEDFLISLVNTLDMEFVYFLHNNPAYYDDPQLVDQFIDKIFSAIQAR